MTDAERRRIANRASADRQKRKRQRQRLEAEGLHPALIDQIIEQQAWDDLVARQGLARASQIRHDHAHHDPDDAGYEPTNGDPLLRGAARATGKAAKVVRRQSTVTRYQHDRM
jgi:hypothetical protein